jgi:hypothetical protein
VPNLPLTRERGALIGKATTLSLWGELRMLQFTRLVNCTTGYVTFFLVGQKVNKKPTTKTIPIEIGITLLWIPAAQRAAVVFIIVLLLV